MKYESTEKITLKLPSTLYHALRNQAYKQGVALPDFIKSKIELKPSTGSDLADLSLKELIRKTEPRSMNPDSCNSNLGGNKDLELDLAAEA